MNIFCLIRNELGLLVVLAALLLTSAAALGKEISALEPPRKEKLEAFDYFNLILIGTKTRADGQRIACFQLPAGSRQAAGVDNRLGRSRAYISRVNEQSIEVTELLPVNGGMQWAVSRFFWPMADGRPGGTDCPDNREAVDAASIHDTAR